MENSHHLDRVQSSEGKKVRDHLIAVAEERGYHLRCSDKSFVPHIQFRTEEGQTPYPFSLSLNRVVPTFYVRQPSPHERERILREYDGSHMVQHVEVKIPVTDLAIAKRISSDFL